MPSKYDENTKPGRVRLVREHRDDYATEWAAMRAISARLGIRYSMGNCSSMSLSLG